MTTTTIDPTTRLSVSLDRLDAQAFDNVVRLATTYVDTLSKATGFTGFEQTLNSLVFLGMDESNAGHRLLVETLIEIAKDKQNE